MANSAAIPPKLLSSLYAFPEGATGAGHRVVLMEFGGGFHEDDIDRQREALGLMPAQVAPVTAVELGVPNAPLARDVLASIAADFNAPGASLSALKASHGDDFDQFLATLEVSADIQTVRALAPGAEIVVLFAQLGPSAGSVIQFALKHHDPTVIATSWGTSEWRRSFIEVGAVHRALEAARQHGVTVCCAAGDFGALNDPPEVRELAGAPKGKSRVNWPASSPLALACGGTIVQVQDGIRVNERVWETEFPGIRRATGGGMSGRYSRPPWQTPPELTSAADAWTQSGKSFDGRWLPDVAAPAGRTYEVIVGGQTVLVDGTSVAAPFWAALLACISEKLNRKVGWINERLYRLTSAQRAQAFFDVTAGSNAMPPEIPSSFSAQSGWDPCTGFGSPNGTALMALLT